MRKLQEKIIFYNKETNYNLKFETKIYFFLKKNLFNLNSFEFEFEIVLQQYRKLNNKNIFVNNRISKSILKYLIKNKINIIKFVNIKN